MPITDFGLSRKKKSIQKAIKAEEERKAMVKERKEAMGASRWTEKDEEFMRMAIDLSSAAVEHGNEPFGAVLVKDGEVVYTNENQIYSMHDPTFHAEMGLIRKFCAETGITDLSGYTLYSSCEPCFMCSGAMVWVKLGRLVYGAGNVDLEAILGKEGCNCSKMVFAESSWKPEVTAGVLRDEAVAVLKDYFG